MGPEAPIFAEPLGPEVVALELEEQLPELPLTPIESLLIVCLTSCYMYMPSSRVCLQSGMSQQQVPRFRQKTVFCSCFSLLITISVTFYFIEELKV
jgi:hypothetical protein